MTVRPNAPITGPVIMSKTIDIGMFAFSDSDAWTFDDDTNAVYAKPSGADKSALAPVVGVSGTRLANPVI